MEHHAIELHDSTVERVERDGDDLVLVLAAYVHRSAGVPGVDPGSGFTQLAEVRVRAGRVTGLPALPFALASGRLYVAATPHDNCLPAPLVHVGPARLELRGMLGELAVVEGASVRITLVGEAEYVEQFPGM